jgi:uncharacterized RDD family membrane protein YckC
MDKKPLLNLMRFWLFGTFIIVFVAITLYIGLFNPGSFVSSLMSGLPIWGITAVLCIAMYYGYKWYINKKA